MNMEGTKNVTVETNGDILMNSPTNSCGDLLLGSEDMNIDLALEESLNALLHSPPSKKKPEATARSLPSQTRLQQPRMEIPSESRSRSASAASSLQSQNQYNLMNAVLMEVQENAKIPNTYHIPLRRNRNAVSSSYRSSGGGTANAGGSDRDGVASGDTFMDEIMRLDEADLTLTENFLGSNYRVSKSAAYSNAGALMSSIGTKVSQMDNIFDDETNTDKAETTEPSSNKSASTTISSQLKQESTKPIAASVDSTNIGAVASPRIQNFKNMDSLHMKARPYGRSIPLPIPTKVKNRTSPPKSKTKPISSTQQIVTSPPGSASAMVKAAAVAAAIAASNHRKKQTHVAAIVQPVGGTPGNIPIPLISPKTHIPQIQKPIKVATNGVARIATAKSAIPSIRSVVPSSVRSSSTVRSNATYASSSTTRKMTPTPSLLEATKKRSQFGFGVDHTVPSVPLPLPPMKSKPQALRNKVPNTVTVPVVGRRKVGTIFSSTTNVSPSNAKPTSTEGASYERKKQRAKDARVKLNESIERLSVAINLAGTQSKERIKTHKGWSSPPASSAQGAGGLSNGKYSPSSMIGAMVGPKYQNSQKQVSVVTIMEEVSKAADEAKKWDRPSFVGTAATMIQHLNSECEALMKELVQLKKERARWKETEFRGGDCMMQESEAMSHSVSDSGSFDDTDKSRQEKRQNEVDQNTGKRRKVDIIQATDIFSILQYEHAVTSIGSFLDPWSILNALSVSRSWQCRLACMKSDIVWSSLCVKRFGAIHVREWQEKHCEDEVRSLNHYEDGRNMMMKLYQKMNEANMKPKCHYEGTLHLGGGKIDNIVCAWVSMAERSNGETRRSVLTVNGKDIQYSSLPVVELRIMVQNVGIADGCVCVPDQIISVDASTKRRGEEMFEVTSDSRFAKKMINLDGSPRSNHQAAAICNSGGVRNLTELGLFESTVIYTFIHAKACPTTNKFRARAKYVKILVNVRGTTLPLVVHIN